MRLTILVITLIVLAILFVAFLGIQIKKIANAYLDSLSYGDADANKPTFIRINDDTGLDYIFNTKYISFITAVNNTHEKYIIRIYINDSEETSYSFIYNDKSIRDRIYNALSDYYIYDKSILNE